MRTRFEPEIVEALRAAKILRIRAGSEPHRFIGIWVVVAEGRVFVRSWTLERRGWWRVFLEEPRGAIQVGGREVAVRAVRTRSERLKRAVDEAYAEKYRTPGALPYVKGFRVNRRRDTTTELVPL